jgi:hypothetical protein
MPPKQNRVAEYLLGDRRWAVPCASPAGSPSARLYHLRLPEPCIVSDVVLDTRLACTITDVLVCCPQLDESQGNVPRSVQRMPRSQRLISGWSSAKVVDSLGCKFMGVASFLLLHLHCEESISDTELASHASALIDGFPLSKAPPASSVVPLLNICSAVQRLPLPHLAAQSELHLAFALAAARKHVQVAEVCFIPHSIAFWSPPRHAPPADVAARRAHSASLRAHAVPTPQCLSTRCSVRASRRRGARAPTLRVALTAPPHSRNSGSVSAHARPSQTAVLPHCRRLVGRPLLSHHV